jgi:2'-5' RNA ligase
MCTLAPYQACNDAYTEDNRRQRTENSWEVCRLQEQAFVALMLPAELTARVNKVVQDLSDRYNTRVSTAGPHITLIPPFNVSESQLEHFKTDLKEFSASHAPVQVHLQGFSAFPKRVLFVDVYSPDELYSLKESLDNALPSSRHFLPVPRLKFNPHVSVASKGVKERSFDAAWAELQSKPFEGSWTATELTLLLFKDQKRWVEAEKFSFGGNEPGGSPACSQ